MLGKWFRSAKAAAPGREKSDREILEGIVQEAFVEQRRARRWGILFKSLTFAYLFILLGMMYVGGVGVAPVSQSHTALVRVNGVIAADQPASANNIVASLRRAFENEHAKAVLLAINSPGGSPVQAGYVVDEIERLRALHPEKKIYAAIADLGASGGYYIAVAADEIYADKASLVGSIGVTASSFGFVGALDKLGVERRHFTSGKHKAFLDPFSPLKAEEEAFWQQVLGNTHQQFIAVVKAGRGDRLRAGEAYEMSEETLFSGLIWSGEQALALGLIDGLGSAGYVAREVIGEDDIRDYTRKPPLLESLTSQLGAAMGSAAVKAMGLEGQQQLR